MSLTLMPVLERAILHTRLPHPALIIKQRRCLVSLQFDKPWLADIYGRLTCIWRETLEEELIGGGEGAEGLSFLYPALQQSGQRSPKHPIKQLHSFQESHRDGVWGTPGFSAGLLGCRRPAGPSGTAAGLQTPESRHVCRGLSSSNIPSRAAAKLMRTRGPDQST